MTTMEQMEYEACNPADVCMGHFNLGASIPYGVTAEHVCAAMNDFISFIRAVNIRLYESGMPRFESMLMPANFSSIVGEFMTVSIPKYCSSVVRNRFHNGHPDMLPAGRFAGDAVQYAHVGIEVKASRYLKSWQGHNPENIWLLVFMFDSSRPSDHDKGVPPKPFRFLKVAGAQLEESDWKFAGRSATSRRTITASVTETGYQKIMANWIYEAPAH